MADFMDMLLAGRASADDFPVCVGHWHDAPETAPESSLPLHEFLGMSWEEFALVVARPESLPLVVRARREGRLLHPLIEELSLEETASEEEEAARRIWRWLVESGQAAPRGDLL